MDTTTNRTPASRDPRAIIPGNPEHLYAIARSQQRDAHAFDTYGAHWRRVDFGDWSGVAHDAAVAKALDYSNAQFAFCDRLHLSATATIAYADALSWAQRKAADAVAQLDQADRLDTAASTDTASEAEQEQDNSARAQVARLREDATRTIAEARAYIARAEGDYNAALSALAARPEGQQRIVANPEPFQIVQPPTASALSVFTLMTIGATLTPADIATDHGPLGDIASGPYPLSTHSAGVVPATVPAPTPPGPSGSPAALDSPPAVHLPLATPNTATPPATAAHPRPPLPAIGPPLDPGNRPGAPTPHTNDSPPTSSTPRPAAPTHPAPQTDTPSTTTPDPTNHHHTGGHHDNGNQHNRDQGSKNQGSRDQGSRDQGSGDNARGGTTPPNESPSGGAPTTEPRTPSLQPSGSPPASPPTLTPDIPPSTGQPTIPHPPPSPMPGQPLIYPPAPVLSPDTPAVPVSPPGVPIPPMPAAPPAEHTDRHQHPPRHTQPPPSEEQQDPDPDSDSDSDSDSQNPTEPAPGTHRADPDTTHSHGPDTADPPGVPDPAHTPQEQGHPAQPDGAHPQSAPSSSGATSPVAAPGSGGVELGPGVWIPGTVVATASAMYVLHRLRRRHADTLGRSSSHYPPITPTGRDLHRTHLARTARDQDPLDYDHPGIRDTHTETPPAWTAPGSGPLDPWSAGATPGQGPDDQPTSPALPAVSGESPPPQDGSVPAGQPAHHEHPSPTPTSPSTWVDVGEDATGVLALDLAAVPGIGIHGPAAEAVIRAIMITALASHTLANPDLPATGRVIIAAPDAIDLFDTDGVGHLIPAGLYITPDLNTALDILDTAYSDRAAATPDRVTGHPCEWPLLLLILAGAPTDPAATQRLHDILDAATHHGFNIAAVILGIWPAGANIGVAANPATVTTTTGPTVDPLHGARLYTIPAGRTRHLLTQLTHPNTFDNHPPHTTQPDTDTDTADSGIANHTSSTGEPSTPPSNLDPVPDGDTAHTTAPIDIPAPARTDPTEHNSTKNHTDPDPHQHHLDERGDPESQWCQPDEHDPTEAHPQDNAGAPEQMSEPDTAINTTAPQHWKASHTAALDDPSSPDAIAVTEPIPTTPGQHGTECDTDHPAHARENPPGRSGEESCPDTELDIPDMPEDQDDADAPARLQLRVFGTVQLLWTPPPDYTTHGQPHSTRTIPLSNRQAELLLYLALNPGARREAIAAALWPDTTRPGLPTNTVNTTLSRLRTYVNEATHAAVTNIVPATGNGKCALDPHLIEVDYWKLRFPPLCGHFECGVSDLGLARFGGSGSRR
jgi:hypothetical protein